MRKLRFESLLPSLGAGPNPPRNRGQLNKRRGVTARPKTHTTPGLSKAALRRVTAAPPGVEESPSCIERGASRKRGKGRSWVLTVQIGVLFGGREQQRPMPNW